MLFGNLCGHHFEIWEDGKYHRLTHKNLCEYSDHGKPVAELCQKRRCSATQMQHTNSHPRPYKSCSIEHKWTSPDVFMEVEHRWSIPQVFFVLEERQLSWLHLLEPSPVLACGLSHQGPARWMSIMNLQEVIQWVFKCHVSSKLLAHGTLPRAIFI